MRAQYGWAVIGFGGMGHWHMENIINRVPELKVIGAYDVRPETYENGLPEGAVGYDALPALLEDERVQIVTVATPNNFHRDLVIACLDAGKHVVCEKPVAMNAGELEEMTAAARRNGKVFSIHQNRRWDRDYLTVRKVLEAGAVGKPYYIESRVQGSRRSMHGWRGYKINGGGMIYDWGIHLFDQLLNLIDSPVTAVYCQAKYVHCEEVDDNFKAYFQFENGVSTLVEIATNCFVNLPRWHVSCKEGTFSVDDWSCNGRVVRLSTDAEMEWDDEIVYTDAGPTRTMAPRPKHTLLEEELPKVQGDWSEYYRNIIGVLEGKEALLVTPEQGLRVMRVVDACFESVKTGQSVAVRI